MVKKLIKKFRKKIFFPLSDSEKLISSYLIKELKQGPIVVVDIGHHKGHFIQHFISTYSLNRKSLYIHAVDPVDYNSEFNDVFDQVAISSNVGTATLNIYDEPGCNSLANMRLEALTLKKNQSGWFSNYTINKIGESQVQTITLETILLKYPIVHYLKVDAQGSDLDVLKSGKSSLKSVMFVQIESSVARNSEELMYVGQSYFVENTSYMKSLGFTLLQIDDHSSDAPPEADLIFINDLFRI